jgi:hypothetical protein
LTWPAYERLLRECVGQELKLGSMDAAGAMDTSDLLAIPSQKRLFARQRHALWVTLGAIAVLVLMTLLTLNPLPTVFCPVVVFAMVMHLDRIRRSPEVFRFAALRLATETLRVLFAVAHKPDLGNWILTQRLHSSHAVAALARLATTSVKDDGSASTADLSKDPWNVWRTGQSQYFAVASARESHRSLWAGRMFRWAFGLVAVIGSAVGIWHLSDPGAAGHPLYRQALAVASGLGSIGLALITMARERKCFEQSLDYEHMRRLFERSESGNDEILVCEAVAEHTRWAIRMAGHFREEMK